MSATATLPDQKSDYKVSKEQIAQCQRDGHILLRGVMSPAEIAAFQPVFVKAVQEYNKETRPLAQRDTYGKAFLQVMNLWLRDEDVKKYTLARRFAKIAADLMGVSGVRIYHDQALHKEAGGGPTPWHQDQFYWPLDNANSITMWMPFTDVPVEAGALTFASGSNKDGYLSAIPISDLSEAHYNKYVDEKKFKVVCEPLKAGDCTFHYGWTLHKAPGNQLKHTREVMTVIYIQDGTKIIEPDNQNRINDMKTWFPGRKPGELADTAINPLVYKR
ncbi:MAG TPA: phytanoyl-CoA dioxygenase family protein [Planctomycetota bacterium]|nr:phytanoyl-CoA dioxygenase family protein [Planctomycetota bacterium]